MRLSFLWALSDFLYQPLNRQFVKEEIPKDPEMLDTVFKVGAWTWQWMEPAIGTASFVLLGELGWCTFRILLDCAVLFPGSLSLVLLNATSVPIDSKSYAEN